MSSSTYGTYYWSELICKPNRYVLLMLEELTKAMNSIKGNWVKQYWKSSSFGEMIARHERRLQTLRQNLIVSLSGISRLCLHILFVPSLSRWWATDDVWRPQLLQETETPT